MAEKPHYWSAEVTEHDHPYALPPGLFANGSAQEIAQALKHSAETNPKHKEHPFASAMSMLDFYINRAGSGLSTEDREKLDNVKTELRRAFGRE